MPSGVELVLFDDQHLIVVGQTGSGKTTAVRSIADALVSRDDLLVIEIDPLFNVVRTTSHGHTEDRHVYDTIGDLEVIVRTIREANEDRLGMQAARSLVVVIDHAEQALRSREILEDLARISDTPGARLILALQDPAAEFLPVAEADVLSFGVVSAQSATGISALTGSDTQRLPRLSEQLRGLKGMAYFVTRRPPFMTTAVFRPSATPRGGSELAGVVNALGGEIVAIAETGVRLNPVDGFAPGSQTARSGAGSSPSTAE